MVFNIIKLLQRENITNIYNQLPRCHVCFRLFFKKSIITEEALCVHVCLQSHSALYTHRDNSQPLNLMFIIPLHIGNFQTICV